MNPSINTLKLLLLIFIIGLITACQPLNLSKLEEPLHLQDYPYIPHFAYSLQYNDSTEQALWLAYQLKATELEHNVERTDKFLIDTLVSTGTANNADYKGSGFDRGHLAPAADMVWNEQAMMESFYFSNISPQLAGFNRGIWKRLEVQTREWAVQYDSIYITTGPLFIQADSCFGENEVRVPTHFFKTILIYQDTIQQGIAFLFPHEKCKGDIFDYAISIDSLESFSKFNLFHKLPDKRENEIELKFDLKYWQEK